MDRETVEPSVGALPGPNAQRRIEYHEQFAAQSTYVYEFVWDITKDAIGPFCTDADGNVLMDFTSHVGGAPLGYNNPRILDRMKSFDLIDPLKIAGQDFYTTAGDPLDIEFPVPAELMERLVEASSHYDMDTVFLINSGAEAVENALKICYDYTAGKYGITFQGGFHGRTLGTLSLNRSKEIHRRKFPEISAVHDVPYCEDRHCNSTTCSCGFFAGDASQLRKVLDPDRGHVDADEVAYIVIEPVQGEGGYRIPSEPFLEEVQLLCDQHDILLVADEIQSGVGRTGTFWGSDATPLEPDVITAAKGLRVGATIATEDVFPEEKGRISSTWGAGDIIASMQGAVTIDAIQEDGLLVNAKKRGRQAVETLRSYTLPNVVDVRGRGLLLAIELDTKQRRDDVLEAAFQQGLLTLGCGYKTIRILPPLDVTEREIDLGCELLAGAVKDAA